ncbi:MAG: TSCPD domain-containing protein, partial [Bacteroidota bacterium]|nr:TSCPD domain-containing protein [Bacteroidota bacterium]
ESRKATIELAETRGVFPEYDKSIYKDLGVKVRNATTTTIAPTGTLSIIAGVSSGIEPLFAISYIRNVMDNDELLEVNPLFKQIAMIDGFYSDDLMRRIAQKGSAKDFPEIPKDVQSVFSTAHDISPEWHIKMQAAFQKYTDNAVSKTVNLSHDATQDDVRTVFEHAYKAYCKGVTIYRDGSRDMQVLNIGKVSGKEDKAGETAAVKESEAEHISPRPRPDITTGFTEKVRIGCGNLYITVNYDEHGICEVFTNTGRAGGCPSQSEATSRLVSIALRSGIDAKAIVEQLKGIRCPSTIRQKGLKVMSCPDAIGRLVEKVMKIQSGKDEEISEPVAVEEVRNIPGPTAKFDNESSVCSAMDFDSPEEQDEIKVSAMTACPECGKPLEHEGGCVVCRNCGFSKCG